MIRNGSKTGWQLAALAVLGLAAAQPASAQTYTITDLGVFSDGYRSYAQGINGLGHAVGQADRKRVYHAFRYTGNGLLDLGTLGGSTSYARGINDQGYIVGYSLNRSGIWRAYVWEPQRKKMSDLGTLGGSASYAYAINNAATFQIVGSSYISGNSARHAFRYTNGVWEDLGTLGGTNSAAYGIGNLGQVVGEADVADPYTGWNVATRAFYWDPVAGMQDLGTLGGTNSAAYGINGAGQVVGYSETDSGSVPVLWQDGQPASLGTFGGTRGAALGINTSGAVVGWANNVYSVQLAFLWKNGMLTDLNTLLPADSGWRLFQATAINDNGEIVGYGTRNGSAYPHAFLMKPAS